MANREAYTGNEYGNAWHETLLDNGLVVVYYGQLDNPNGKIDSGELTPVQFTSILEHIATNVGDFSVFESNFSLVHSNCVDGRGDRGILGTQLNVNPRAKVPGGNRIYSLYLLALSTLLSDTPMLELYRAVDDMLAKKNVVGGMHENCAAIGKMRSVLQQFGDRENIIKMAQLGGVRREFLTEEFIAALINNSAQAIWCLDGSPDFTEDNIIKGSCLAKTSQYSLSSVVYCNR